MVPRHSAWQQPVQRSLSCCFFYCVWKAERNVNPIGIVLCDLKKKQNIRGKTRLKWNETAILWEERRKDTVEINFVFDAVFAFVPISYCLFSINVPFLVVRRANEIPIKQHVSQHVSVHLGLFRLLDGRRLNWWFRQVRIKTHTEKRLRLYVLDRLAKQRPITSNT